eukprot:5822296-Ditylum_brightwellii.AAC.1
MSSIHNFLKKYGGLLCGEVRGLFLVGCGGEKFNLDSPGPHMASPGKLPPQSFAATYPTPHEVKEMMGGGGQAVPLH